MKRGKHMKIVNNTQVDNPNQWIESFVEEVLDNAKIDCEQILIEKIEEEKHIFLDVDGEKYDIRLWAFLRCGGFERYGMQGECAVYALSEKERI